MSDNRSMHYRPVSGVLGDTMPFYWQGWYHLFYLRRPPFHDAVTGLTIEHVVSDDLVSWSELPTAVVPGSPGEPDCDLCGCGCVVEREGTFYCFYLGRNSASRTPETICLATSNDLVAWRKSPTNPILLPDTRWYGIGRWSDPVVLWNNGDESYWMLIATHDKDAPAAFKGCVGLAVSPDLREWEVREPLWSPGTLPVPECPDIFRLGGKWCLLTNWINAGGAVCRLADTLDGPWTAPRRDTLDSFDTYAFKTLADGERRIAFGWVTTRTDSHDSDPPTWGGHLAAPRELSLSPDGELMVRCVPEWFELFSDRVNLQLGPRWGAWESRQSEIVGARTGGAAYALVSPIVGDLLLQCDLTLDSEASSAGFLLHSDPELARFYMVRIDAKKGRVRIERQPPVWPKSWTIEQQLQTFSDKPVKCVLSVADNILEVFIDDTIALTMRLYDYRKGRVGLFVEEGSACFKNLRLEVPIDKRART
ncbi:MAG: GH32 C-terminal domain-containing protein [Armatimonadetes bacterium]|nr:GH32 C-terminal domain-containing protein [Armatimonadota bacterium]